MIIVESLDSSNSRMPEYDKYLEDHIFNVNKSLKLLLPHLMNDLDEDTINTIKDNCMNHDKSKYTSEEYNAYLNWWYPEKESDKNESEYNLAWLHHQHNNPHHSQHWVLRKDDGTDEVFDMPIEHIIEMLCDWHSFSASSPDSTAFNWYNEEGTKCVMSDGTRRIINKYIKYLKDPLYKEGDECD